MGSVKDVCSADGEDPALVSAPNTLHIVPHCVTSRGGRARAAGARRSESDSARLSEEIVVAGSTKMFQERHVGVLIICWIRPRIFGSAETH